MNSKKRILKRLKNCSLDRVELKDMDIELSSFEDKVGSFKKSLELSGGETILTDKNSLKSVLKEYQKGNFLDYTSKNERKFKDPHELKDIDTIIVKGRFGVCENGAVWCDSDEVEFKASFFICKNLVILLDRKKLLNNMNEAYKELDYESFGVFISGASKTADIEQSLVIGAHGAIKSVVVLY